MNQYINNSKLYNSKQEAINDGNEILINLDKMEMEFNINRN